MNSMFPYGHRVIPQPPAGFTPVVLMASDGWPAASDPARFAGWSQNRLLTGTHAITALSLCNPPPAALGGESK